MARHIQEACDLVVSVDVLDSHDAAHLALMKRPELGVTLTKLHAWRIRLQTGGGDFQGPRRDGPGRGII